MSRYIVIEGLIGVGKTSLCRLVQREWKAKLILEPAEDNPFLSSFYQDPKRFAFPAQMFYLASRYAQQMELHQGDLFSELIVADYLYAKDRLFAEQTLDADELKLYDRIAGMLGANVAKPEFVLFLDAPTEVVMDRIGRRAIEAEQVIKADYLDELRDRYFRLWDRFEDAPVYVLDTTAINYVDRAEDQQRILDLVRAWLAGTPLADAPEAYQRPAVQLDLFGL